MADPLQILAHGLARAVPEWDFLQLERRGARHPLVRSGLLACIRTAERYDCHCGNCDARPTLFKRTDGHWAYVCALTGATRDIADMDEIRIWRYEPQRMAELLRDLLACPEAHPVDANTWRLGPSAHPALAGRAVYVQTRAAEEPLQRARNAAPDASCVLVAGRADTLPPDSPLRRDTFVFGQILALAPDGAATLRPGAFAAGAPDPAGQNDADLGRKLDRNTRAVDKLGAEIKRLKQRYDGDYNAPNLRNRVNSRLVNKALDKYWELVGDRHPRHLALTDACRAVEAAAGLGKYKNFGSFRNAVSREIKKANDRHMPRGV